MKQGFARKLFAAVLLVTMIAGTFYVNFSRSANASLAASGPAIMGMEDGGLAAEQGTVVADSGVPVKPRVHLTTAAASMDKDLTSLPQTGPAEKKMNPEMFVPSFDLAPADAVAVDTVAQTDAVNAMPAASASFAGLDLQNWGGGWPPDTHGAVGPNHYIQAVNTSMAIYNKAGTRLAAMSLNTFFDGTGTPCDANNQGDPIVLYDQYSGRFIVTGFAWSSTRGPFYECIAVSKTADPVSGGWWMYGSQVHASQMNDYPKLGVWPDGIYAGYNMFYQARTYKGARLVVYNRDDMTNGLPLRTVSFALSTSYFSVFPSTTAPSGGTPPAGTPNFFFSNYGVSNALRMWKFSVNWATPSASTLTGPTTVSVAAFTKPSARVPQKGTTVTLDTLGDRLMSNIEYRNLNGAESIWIAHTVVSGSVTGIRWYELRNSGGTVTTYQQGTFQPDTTYRWMPSLSVDKQGNMAVGYSASSSTLNPQIRYAGRLVSDPLGQLTQGEATLVAGTGSQTSYTRWGDYATMTMDPADGCTFWLSTEYYLATGTNWQTRIGAFKFPGCTP